MSEHPRDSRRDSPRFAATPRRARRRTANDASRRRRARDGDDDDPARRDDGRAGGARTTREDGGDARERDGDARDGTTRERDGREGRASEKRGKGRRRERSGGVERGGKGDARATDADDVLPHAPVVQGNESALAPWQRGGAGALPSMMKMGEVAEVGHALRERLRRRTTWRWARSRKSPHVRGTLGLAARSCQTFSRTDTSVHLFGRTSDGDVIHVEIKHARPKIERKNDGCARWQPRE